MDRPEVRHGVPRGEVRRLERIVEQFSKLLSSNVKRMVAIGILDLDRDLEPSVENLLCLRKELVRAVEVGMLERKDQEERIGILAALIWYLRLEEAQRLDIDRADLRG